jgi:hypothetical protein
MEDKRKIRLEIRRLIGDLVKEEHDLVLNVINQQINIGADEGANERFFENSGVDKEIIKENREFGGNFEYLTELKGYTVSFYGSFEAKKMLSESEGLSEYEVDALLENIKIDGENNLSIDFDVLSKKHVIPEGTLSDLENNLSEVVRSYLE